MSFFNECDVEEPVGKYRRILQGFADLDETTDMTLACAWALGRIAILEREHATLKDALAQIVNFVDQQQTSIKARVR